MNMKLWNFLEKISEIEDKTIYIENYQYEQDPTDGSEEHSIEINCEDNESETYEASYLLTADTRENLEKQVEFLKNEYLEGIEIVEDCCE